MRCSFLTAESCTSELQPHPSNTNHLLIPHFLACHFHVESIRTHILLPWFPCWGLFCAHTQRKRAVAPPYENPDI